MEQNVEIKNRDVNVTVTTNKKITAGLQCCFIFWMAMLHLNTMIR